MQFKDQKIQIMAIDDIQESPSTSRSKWFRRTVQIFDGHLAGQQQIYGDKEKLELLSQGWCLVDLLGRHGDYGNIDYYLTNHRVLKQQVSQQAK